MTKIRISAKYTTNAQLTIVDYSGRILAKLFEGSIEEGVPNYVDFDASQIQSGMYIARLVGADGIITYTTILVVK
jgi:hypothetical protein